MAHHDYTTLLGGGGDGVKVAAIKDGGHGGGN